MSEHGNEGIEISGGTLTSSVTIVGRYARYDVRGNSVISQGVQPSHAASGLTPQRAGEIINEIKTLITMSVLPEADQTIALQRLGVAGQEAQKQEPDKDDIAHNLKKITETMKQAGEVITTTSALGKLLIPLADWLGKSIGWFCL